jgi:glucokinase
MPGLVLVGDIGGTNSRFGLVPSGETAVRDIEALKNDKFESLEAVIAHYVTSRGIDSLEGLSIAVAAPVTGDTVTLTNRAWTFSRASLKAASRAQSVTILNDFEALAMSLPHLGAGELDQIGGETPQKPGVKIVLGPGTGLGMATLTPLPGGGWLALPGELGHIHLPVGTREEFELREKMSQPGVFFESEDAVTGGGLLRIYRAIAGAEAKLATPEAVLAAALDRADEAAIGTLDQFIVWLARLAGDAAMTMQTHGGVYLAGNIVNAILGPLKSGPFRQIFQEKGRVSYVMRPIPVYVITAKFPALTGCAAAFR